MLPVTGTVVTVGRPRSGAPISDAAPASGGSGQDGAGRHARGGGTAVRRDRCGGTRRDGGAARLVRRAPAHALLLAEVSAHVIDASWLPFRVDRQQTQHRLTVGLLGAAGGELRDPAVHRREHPITVADTLQPVERGAEQFAQLVLARQP